jgi:hypothetical protein
MSVRRYISHAEKSPAQIVTNVAISIKGSWLSIACPVSTVNGRPIEYPNGINAILRRNKGHINCRLSNNEVSDTANTGPNVHGSGALTMDRINPPHIPTTNVKSTCNKNPPIKKPGKYGQINDDTLISDRQ